MKQLLQSARTGEISIAEVPSPRVQPGCVLVFNDDSLGSVPYICNRDSWCAAELCRHTRLMTSPRTLTPC